MAAFIETIASEFETETSGRDNLGSLGVVLEAVVSVERGQAMTYDVSSSGALPGGHTAATPT